MSTLLAPFTGLPDDTRLWCYGFRTALTPAQEATVAEALRQFTVAWQTHGAEVRGAWCLVEHQFALLAAATTVSGCSIDSSVRVFKALRQQHGLDALDLTRVFYRHAGQVVAVTRPEFAARVRQGTVTADTPVFDLTLRTLADLRAGGFEQPFARTWHATAFAA